MGFLGEILVTVPLGAHFNSTLGLRSSVSAPSTNSFPPLTVAFKLLDETVFPTPMA